jgi:hypothetical protein
MRVWVRAAVLAALLAGAGAWCYLDSERLTRQWSIHRLGRAETLAQARAEIARLETGPERQAAVRDLVATWGTGSPQFDLYLAWYVGQPSSSELLRETFSLELAWREPLLARWAHYWSWRAQQEPDAEVSSIRAHLDMLVSGDPPDPIPWREVLNLQAVFALSGHARLAKRLQPDNWRQRYRDWRQAVQGAVPHIARPEAPFPDWPGPIPDRKRLAGP